MTDAWIILRVASRDTLRLAQSLAEDQFDVWTPIEVKTMRVPRMNAKRDVRQAMLPGFIFAKVGHLVDLLNLSNNPVKMRRGSGFRLPAHADFSVFHYHHGIPMVRDRDLNPLRRIARRRTAKQKAPPLKPRQMVRAKEGAGSFQGMIGTVEQSNETKTIVCFGGLFGKVELPTSFLNPDDVCALVPQRKAA